MGVARGVDAGAAVEQIVPGAAVKQVVAGLAVQFVVAGPSGEHIVAVAGVDHVVASTRHQHVIAGGAGERVTVLVGDAHRGTVAAAVAVVGGVGAVVVRGDVMGPRVVDGQGQLVVFCAFAVLATVVDVGDTDLVSTISLGGDGLAITD
ncbi:hypothetical protein D3C73_825180 [compost metagenome]